MYDIFGFRLLHDLHLFISKLLKECIFKYLGSDGVITHHGTVMEHMRLLNRMGLLITRDGNCLHAVIDQEAAVSNLQVDYSSRGCSTQMNGFLVNSGVCGIPEGKDYCTVDMVFRL